MDGVGLARRIVEETSDKAAELARRVGVTPCLATVLVGEDPASVTYVRMKRARCAKAGIESRLVSLPAATTTAELVETLQSLSRDAGVHGILLQHPVGPHIDERAAFESIAPEKDVDGVTMSSFGAMSFDCLIDAGYNPGNVGDVDFDTARTRARLITPVPGGVGPMTIAVLLAQTVDAASIQLGLGLTTE